MNRVLLITSIFLFVQCTVNDDKLFSKLESSATGIKFKNVLRETDDFNVLKYPYFYNGGGISVGDVNNDGLPDVYFTGNLVSSRLYLNKGDWEFEEIAEEAGVSATGLWNTGVVMVDLNADGFLDIYVCRSAAKDPDKRKNLLFINNQDLTFTEQASNFGLDDPGYTTHASFFDYDNDGDLDAYILNHSLQEYSGFNKLIGYFKTREDDRYGNKLYRNDGGKFVNVTKQAGIINNVLGFGLGVVVSDVNQDNWMDIYVTNDFNEEDYLYINQKNGTFKESITEYFGHVSLFSMGCDGADINNDLKPDIVTLDMMPESNHRQKMSLGDENYEKYDRLIQSGFHHQTMRNMLQLNNGNGSFSEIGQLAGVSNTDWSWSALLADYDNDGWKDLYVTNGYMRNYLDMDFMNYAVDNRLEFSPDEVYSKLLENMPSIKEENCVFQNNGDLTFTKKNEDWGLNFPTVSNGAVYADLDNDGDLDLITNNVNEEAHVYRNNSETVVGNSYLKVRLKGKGKNTFGIGAKVVAYANGNSMLQEFVPVRGFQSSVDYELLFGLGSVSTVDSITVLWPDSSVQKLSGIPANQTLLLDQKDASFTSISPKNKPTLFVEHLEKLAIDFEHKENDFEDFKKNKLLPYGISTSGPSMAAADINGDGLEDIFIGGAKGSTGQIYVQQVTGSFLKKESKTFLFDSLSEDTDGIFFDADGDTDMDLYVTSGGSDFEIKSPNLQDRLYLNDGQGNFTKSPNLPEMFTSTSSVTISDIDRDGDLDVFVGGRLTPGRYPTNPRSYVLLNDGKGNFEDYTSIVCKELLAPGMVTDVEFVEINGDGYEDLVVVGDWTRVMVFMNNDGKGFVESNSKSLAQTEGWWNAIHANDFDSDGDVDLVLGNFGRNNLYQPTSTRPVSLVYKDFDNDGSIDPLLNYYILDENHFAYSRDELLAQIISLKKKFPDYKSFAKASPADFFSPQQAANADTLQAVMFESVYLENDGGGNFEIRILPIESQFSPVYAIQSLDVNNDGKLDLITAGNQSMTRVSTGKYDANYGVVLLGDGQGSFTTLDQSTTGFDLQGDIRDINILKAKDVDFILFTRNNESLKVYQKNSF